jgi:hypothetical protein
MQVLVFRLILLVPALMMLDGATDSVRAQSLRLEDLQQTRARPLFSPLRRAETQRINLPRQPMVAAPVAPPPIEPPALLLVGVALGSGEQKVVITRPSAPKSLTLSLGDDIDGWHVAAIEARAFVLERNRRSIKITFPTNQPTSSQQAWPKGLAKLP